MMFGWALSHGYFAVSFIERTRFHDPELKNMKKKRAFSAVCLLLVFQNSIDCLKEYIVTIACTHKQKYSIYLQYFFC